MLGTILNQGLYSTYLSPGDTAIPLYCLFLCIAVGYLLGSLNSAVIVSRLLYGDDVRKYGSKNAGLTNMYRTYGKKAAVFTLLGDILKTVLAVFLTGLFFGFYYANIISLNYLCYISGLACVIGHIKPIYYGFRGGKGVLCTATVIGILSPIVLLVLLISFVLIVWGTKYISLGSIVCAGLYPVAVESYMMIFGGTYDTTIKLFAFLFAVLVIICHRTNLVRLWRRQENKFSFHKKDPVPPTESSEEEK